MSISAATSVGQWLSSSALSGRFAGRKRRSGPRRSALLELDEDDGVDERALVGGQAKHAVDVGAARRRRDVRKHLGRVVDVVAGLLGRDAAATGVFESAI